MKNLTRIIIQTSCDTQFINRVAMSDPFEYWNRCIVPGTAKDSFEDNLHPKNMDVKITRIDQMPFNYQIEYEMEKPNIHSIQQNCGYAFEAIINYFGFYNVVKIENISL
jgi:hypothetical protein